MFRRFLSYYRGQLGLFVADIVCSLVVALVDLAFPQILRSLTSGLFTEGSDTILSSLLYIAIGLVVMYLVRLGCRYFVIFWGHIMGARMESHMREDLFDAYERQGISYHDHHNSGDLMSRLVSDLFDISETAHHGPEFLIIGVVEIVGSFVILGSINTSLTTVLAVIAAALIAYDVYANLRMLSVYDTNRERIADVNSRLEDSLAGIREVKGFAAEDLERERFRECNDAYLDSKWEMYRAMGRYQGAISALMGALNTVIVVYGGWLVAQGQMEVADLATYALYISMFTTPITNILNFTETFQNAVAGFKRFCEVLDTEPDIEDKPDAPDLVVSKGAVEYCDVHFSYEKDTEVIHGFTLNVEPGTTLALVGPSGGGKTTVCSLLPRLYDVDSGAVLIDGQDVREVTQKSLRQSVGFVRQDAYLFDGTIAENIAYGKPGASIDEIREAARHANIADFIESLPEAYETRVGERGSHLSGGQRQRIAIARVFLKDPPILIFDEATSSLDNESERAVQASLAELSRGRTTIVIAHRLSTIRGAEVIATVDNGRVVELGTHEELLAQGGTYARYYQMQFGDGFVMTKSSI